MAIILIKNLNLLTCQQDNLNPLTSDLALSYSAQEHAVLLHCLPQAYLLCFSILLASFQIGKAWPKFLPFPPLILLPVDLHPVDDKGKIIV